MSCRRRCRRHFAPPGFSLPELLVGIGIIAALVALLVPMIGVARDQAKAARCLANLRQLTQAATVYCAANDGVYPIAYYFPVQEGGKTVTRNWDFTTIEGGGGRQVQPGLIWAGLPSAEVQQCPSYEVTDPGGDPYTGYNYNTSYIGHGEGEVIQLSVRAAAVKRPARCALFGDGQYWGGPDKFMRAPFPNPGDANFRDRSAGTQGFRHRRATNVAFCDGHAESLRDRFAATSDTTPPSADTGFLSPDNSMYSTD
jgi:prepilin-type processing-associated H-X9-DG protein/prepilin-type N-terminal cleavage/methylation domain-containing protein